MGAIDWILLAVILLIVGGAVAYIVKAKRSGQRCIGCPHSASCASAGQSHSCNGNCGGCKSDCKGTKS